jgi:hypothetical protein
LAIQLNKKNDDEIIGLFIGLNEKKRKEEELIEK